MSFSSVISQVANSLKQAKIPWNNWNHTGLKIAQELNWYAVDAKIRLTDSTSGHTNVKNP